MFQCLKSEAHSDSETFCSQWDCSVQNVEILHDKNTNLFGILGNKADSPGAVTGKKCTCQWRRHKWHEFNPWVRYIPWGSKKLRTPVFLSGKSHGQRNLEDYIPKDCRVRHDQVYMQCTLGSNYIGIVIPTIIINYPTCFVMNYKSRSNMLLFKTMAAYLWKKNYLITLSL